MLKKIKNWFLQYKKNQQEKYIDEVLQRFNLTEKGCSLYLVIENRAVQKMDPEWTVREAIQELQKARLAQLSYLKSIE